MFARLLYRSVTVVDPEPGWLAGPALLTVNHFGAFADPALLVAVLRRRPRFLAKSTLWRLKPFGWLLDWAGAVPVYRAQDGSTAGNLDTFRACYEALLAEEAVAIFPEGLTHDDPALREIRTGAARIALGARQAGVAGLTVVPVGIHYEDKAALRSRVLVLVGDPLDLDSEIGRFVAPDDAEGPENHKAVELLTAEIEARLRAAAPGFTDRREVALLSLAAGAALRTEQPGHSGPVHYGDRQLVANRLARRPAAAKVGLIAAAEAYRADLEGLGMTDREFMVRSGGDSRLRSFATAVLRVVVLLPYALAGAAFNVVPYAVVRLTPRLDLRSGTMGMVRAIVAVAAFGITWTAWAIAAGLVWEWRVGLLALVLVPLYGGVALYVLNRIVALGRYRRAARLRTRLGRRGVQISDDRAALVGEVRRAVFATDGMT